MKKILSWLHKGLLGYFAIVGTLSVLIFLYPGMASNETMVKIQPAVLGLWLISALYFLAVFLSSSGLRDSLLGCIAVVKERDECEQYIVGRAAKAVFLVTLGGFLAVGIWGMSTVNVLFIQNSERIEDGIKKAVPFVGLALPVQWQKHAQMAWIQHNQNEPLVCKSVEDVNVMIYRKGYQILLTPPIHPILSQVMFVCAFLQIALFHLFSRIIRRRLNTPK